ncbi:cytochrome-c peroxidase [Reyranella sp.]|uniref:cytochrome-c peroxidase n=1 Tax=Reyranella sp. TaxID=1929291 RepID=UPI003784B4A1
MTGRREARGRRKASAWRAALLVVTLIVGVNAQGLAQPRWSEDEVRAIGAHGPWPPPATLDPSNRVSGRPAAIALGERLFNDVRLSGDGTLSCASCHQSERNWSDGRARARGRVGLDRRTPSLWNVGQGYWFGWDGAADSLWAQSLRPIIDPREMAASAGRVAALLRGEPTLSCLYRRAFGTAPGQDDEAVLVEAAKALAAFQETLVSPRTAFDDFRDALVAGDSAAAAHYPAAAQRGLKIFVGIGNCNACHFGPRFTNGEFGDVGVPFFVRPGVVDSGRMGGLAKLAASPFNRLGPYNDDKSDAGALRTRHVQRLHANFGEFRVPGLRQLGSAGPYMHNGQLATLQDVVRHYSEVDPDRLHSDGVPLVRPLALSADDQADLVAFLRSLTAEPPARAVTTPECGAG